MTVEEAKKVSVSVASSPFENAPPRRIDDIISVLNEPGRFDSNVTQSYLTRVNELPPETSDPATLKGFYRERGEASYQLGHYMQAKEDLQKALGFKAAFHQDGFLKGHLGAIERLYGNFQKAIDLFQESAAYPLFETPDGSIYNDMAAYSRLTSLYASIGDIAAARNARQLAVFACGKYRGAMGMFYCQLHAMVMNAAILHAEGRYEEAEVEFRGIKEMGLGPDQSLHKNYPIQALGTDLNRARNLLSQQRVLEAETEARWILMASLAHTGKDSVFTGSVLTFLAEILQSQNRLQEADRLIDATIQIFKKSGVPADSRSMSAALVIKGDILAAQGDFAGACQQYEIARASLVQNRYFFERFFSQNPMIIMSMLMTGRYGEADKFASQNYEIARRQFGEKNENTAVMQGLRGMAREKSGRMRDALQDLEAAVAQLEEIRAAKGDSMGHKQIGRAIMEDYIGLLADIKDGPLEKELKLDAAGVSFTLAEGNREKAVQGALLSASSRVVADVELADLIRREQDTQRHILMIESSLLDLLTAPADQRNERLVGELRSKIELLNQAHRTILVETKRLFPRYADFANPPRVSIADVQKLLQPTEALVSIYTTADKTIVWAVPHKGKALLVSAPLGKRELLAKVVKLRGSLDCNPGTLGDIPDFDIALAHELYEKLLKPVEPAFVGAEDLIFIVNNPLDQLPLAVIPTGPRKPAVQGDPLFAGYRDVPWLVRKYSITMEPSVSSLAALRKMSPADPGRKPFVGFADALFNREQLALAQTKEASKTIQLRGVRVSSKGALDNQSIISIEIERLNRLPDTAEEIKTVAAVLGASQDKDVYLREQASRKQVQTMTLSDRKVIAFATHALVPGDLNGLNQPALALSAPSVTGNAEDGLLTMTDIMKLKLNADWVILSACNTGAASGAGAQALSGLGQAFFYAGSRAILATMYPVETASARKLVTGMFMEQRAESKLSRSQALRRSMLNLMEKENLIDEATGRIAASYAHPFFWAPFMISGDAGSIN